jgi:hypothetical protein
MEISLWFGVKTEIQMGKREQKTAKSKEGLDDIE